MEPYLILGFVTTTEDWFSRIPSLYSLRPILGDLISSSVVWSVQIQIHPCLVYLEHISRENGTRYSIFFSKNPFENTKCKIVDISCLPQYVVNGHTWLNVTAVTGFGSWEVNYSACCRVAASGLTAGIFVHIRHATFPSNNKLKCWLLSLLDFIWWTYYVVFAQNTKTGCHNINDIPPKPKSGLTEK